MRSGFVKEKSLCSSKRCDCRRFWLADGNGNGIKDWGEQRLKSQNGPDSGA
jgi:hypothetical protein